VARWLERLQLAHALHHSLDQLRRLHVGHARWNELAQGEHHRHPRRHVSGGDERGWRGRSNAYSTLYAIGVSNASLDRYGDYTAIRPHWPNTKLFSVSDYFLQESPFSGLQIRHQYRLFGRSGDVGGTQ
jgi:hypothetical protein